MSASSPGAVLEIAARLALADVVAENGAVSEPAN